jgi:serine/threonine protein kinase
MRKDDPLLVSSSPVRNGRYPRFRPRSAAVGETLGKCLLTEAIGRGSSCVVFRALHQGLNIPVAVKVLQLEAGDAHRRAYDQLRNEGRLLAQLQHFNVVRALDFEDDPAFPYLVLECVEGPSLADLIQQSGRLSLERACDVIAQTAGALGALWELGAIHRDVKPGNILLTRAGIVKLVDFGQAVLIEDQEIHGSEAPALPHDDVSGTPLYLAPEQFLAPTTVDHRADIYALGATFYQALTGQPVFTGRSRADVLIKHAKEQPVPPHELVPELGARVSDVVLTMLAKEPGERPQNFKEIKEALANLTAAEGPADTEPAEEERLSQVSAVVPEEAELAVVPEQAQMEVEEAPAEAPRRRSFWRALLPGSSPAKPRPASHDDWLRLMRRTLHASPRRTG